MKPGYKQTEVGIIPEDWDVESLRDIANVKTGPFGSALHAEDYVLSGTPIITVEHLGDSGISRQNLPMVSDKDRKRLSAFALREGDIVFSRVGSVDRNSYVTADEDTWLFSGRLLRIRVYNSRCFSKFLSFYFKNDRVKSRIRDIAVGQTMPSLNTRLISGLPVSLPPLAEQCRIAEVLSDMDELIALLEKLIAKKKAIKQGAMQELLTGKRRLPGFSGEWETCTVENVAVYCTATVATDTIDHRYYVGTDNMVPDKGGVHDNSITIPYSSVREYKTGDILVSNIRPYLKKIWFANKHGGCSNDVLVIRVSENMKITPRLLYFILSQDGFFDEVMANAVGTKMPRGDKSTISQYHIRFPLDKNEQIALVMVISDIVDDVDNVQKKLEKARQIKQGMIQQLMTGRIRLV
jgi:type I restriction enzyme S subunit